MQCSHIESIPGELLDNPEAMRVILDAADIPINYCSADCRFLFVNKTYAQWYGRTPKDIIGKSIIELLGNEGNETIRPYYERALRGEHFRYETEVNLSIGFRYIQCSYTPIFDKNGNATGWVGIIYDMTQHYLLEKALRENEAALRLAKEKAEAANIAKSEFLTNMSHEIRTPMNAVIGLSHILSMTSPLTPKQKEFLDTLQLSAQSLLSLINDMLDFSKIESNRVDLEHIPYNFFSIINEITAMFSVGAHKKGLTLSYDKTPHDDTFFLGDPLRVRQILTNLISNALKFTHSGGVSIRLSITPSSEPNYIYTHVSVKDTGIGIAENKLASVFDKFMQADMSITREYGGSGLGLAISKNLAELMGGSITLESTPGEGSEFILHLPLEYAQQTDIYACNSPKIEKIYSAPTLRNITVLLAEDQPANILVAITMLETMGYRCEVANNGKEVLEKIKLGKHYDIVLMDIQMPELDGYLTTRLLREDEQKNHKKRTPIIGVTAHVLADNIEKCFKAGMDDYITKPYRAEDLKQKISALLQAG
jgi:PAS domain S-box-containing protein